MSFLDILEALIVGVDLGYAETFLDGSTGFELGSFFLAYGDFIREKANFNDPEWVELAEWLDQSDWGTRWTYDVIAVEMKLPVKFIRQLESAKSLDEIKALIKTQSGSHC